MEKRCKNILQNYLKTHVYNTDYKIIDNFLIKYKNITLFYVVSKTKYIKHNICNIIQKEYNHYYYFYYFNNKNNKIYFDKTHQTKIIYNDIEIKYYNKFCKIYKKIYFNYTVDICFYYYYSNIYSSI